MLAITSHNNDILTALKKTKPPIKKSLPIERYIEKFVDFAGKGHMEGLQRIAQEAGPEKTAILTKLTFQKLPNSDYPSSNIIGKTALFNAALGGNADTISFLVQNGASIDFKCFGDTPLFAALETKNENVIERLVSLGANIHEPCSNGKTPLELASELGLNHLLQK